MNSKHTWAVRSTLAALVALALLGYPPFPRSSIEAGLNGLDFQDVTSEVALSRGTGQRTVLFVHAPFGRVVDRLQRVMAEGLGHSGEARPSETQYGMASGQGDLAWTVYDGKRPLIGDVEESDQIAKNTGWCTVSYHESYWHCFQRFLPF